MGHDFLKSNTFEIFYILMFIGLMDETLYVINGT